MNTEQDQRLFALLGQLGGISDKIVSLKGPPEPSHLRYADLVKVPRPGTPRPGAVVEIEEQPVLYIVLASEVAELPRLAELHWILTCRNDAEHLAVVEPGRLTLYPLGLFSSLPSPQQLDTGTAKDALRLRSILVPLHEAAKPELRPDLSKGLFALFHESVRALIGAGLSSDDALSLTGRALFLRFLIDRGIVTDRDRSIISPSAGTLSAAFSSPVAAAATCTWLSGTFNGDLLPLPDEDLDRWFRSIAQKPSSARVFSELSNILFKAPYGQLSFDCSWASLDFGHIPVGLLSQIYEQHSHSYNPWAKSDSVHYTPRRVAEYMVSEVFASLEEPHAARVLDPAVGAGVFLVAAFRRLAEARWQNEGKRPDTRKLREILYGQLAGFDISEPALRLTALSLYLTALELDPDPQPHSALKFDHLRGRVLFDVCEASANNPQRKGLPPLGSLSSELSPEHDGRYDVVIGNPPWTAWKKGAARSFQSEARAAQKAVVETTVQALLKERLGKAAAQGYELVDYVPDLPFCFSALRWARPKGRIALAVHARMLFKRKGAGRRVRELLFQAARVTGILNGSGLRNTEVWPDIAAPFCLLFMENIASQPTDAFYLVSPQCEDALNRRGRMRIDARAARPIERQRLEARPDLMKILFRGGPLDFSVMEKILAAGGEPLSAYWTRLGLRKGEGYKLAADQPQQSAASLQRLPHLDMARPHKNLLVDTARLPKFARATLHRPRSRELYRAPLVLLRESPPASAAATKALLALDDVVFIRSYFGFSAYGHPDAQLLARYLFLILNSDIVLYCTLMQSGTFGVEREALRLAEIYAIRVRPLEALSAAQRSQIPPLADALLHGEATARAEVNQFCFSLYGLTRWDLEVIRDTLEMSLPFATNKANAQSRPDHPEVFRAYLESDLAALAKSSGFTVVVEAHTVTPESPWCFFSLTVGRDGKVRSPPRPFDRARTARFIQLADQTGASQILSREGPGELLIGIVAQKRYLTRSRARECVQTILWEHLDALLVREQT